MNESNTESGQSQRGCLTKPGNVPNVYEVQSRSEIAEQISRSQFEVLLELRNALLIFWATNSGPLPCFGFPQPEPPRQPIALCRILQQKAVKLFDCEHRQCGEAGSSGRAELAIRIEKLVMENIVRFEASTNRLRSHATLDDMRAAIKEGLAAHVRSLPEVHPFERPEEESFRILGRASQEGGPIPAPEPGAINPIPERTNEDAVRRSIGGTETPEMRCALVDEFIARQRHTKRKHVTRTDIWKAAGYGCRTEFERWQRCDIRTTKAAERNILRVLSGR
jgi:hypothetical protein